jgi:hypothetical protein
MAHRHADLHVEQGAMKQLSTANRLDGGIQAP